MSGPVTTSANTYDEILPLEYQKCLVGLDAILSKTWDIANSGHVLYPSSEWVTSFGPIPEYVLQDMFEWLFLSIETEIVFSIAYRIH